MVRRFKELIENIRIQNPDIQVFVSALLPRDISFFPGAKNDLKLLDRCNKRATEVNQDLGQMKGVVIIEHPRFGSDRKSANRRFLSRDGLHLSTDGVRELKLDIETALRFSLKPRTTPSPYICRPAITSPGSFSVPQTTEKPRFCDSDFPPLPSKEKEESVPKKEVPVPVTVPVQKKEVPVPLSVRNKEVPVSLSVRKEEVPVQKKEVPVQKKEVPVPLSVRNKEVPVPLSVRKEEMPVQKKEVPVPVRKKEVIIQKEEVGYPTSSPIPCYNRFEALSDIDESDWFSCELNYEKLSGSRMREASFQGDNEESDWSSRVFDCEELFGSQSQRYSANRYPLSRKHQRQMIRRKMRKTKKTHRQQDIEGSGRSSRAFDCEELSGSQTQESNVQHDSAESDRSSRAVDCEERSSSQTEESSVQHDSAESDRSSRAVDCEERSSSQTEESNVQHDSAESDRSSRAVDCEERSSSQTEESSVQHDSAESDRSSRAVDCEELSGAHANRQQVKRQCGGGASGSVIFREGVETPVSIEYAFDILSQCVEGVFEEELISTEAPIKPKGGDMFVIDTQKFSNKVSRRNDQYLWLNDGSRKYPKSDPVVIKSNWRIKTTTGSAKNPKGAGSSLFKRTEYGLLDSERFFLLHYIGDETVFEPMPHGNAKKSSRNYVKTCPSTIDTIKDELESGLTAGKVYNKLKSTVDGQAAVSRAPRNLKQVENIYMSMQRKKRLSQDDIYNTLELAYQLDGFVMQFDDTYSKFNPNYYTIAPNNLYLYTAIRMINKIKTAYRAYAILCDKRRPRKFRN